jgi:spore germination cell wall hydrolase CwlJ-like protein
MLTAATCLAMAVYYEARGEHPDAQLAVAEVVMNRVADPRFAGDVCGVVKEDWGPAAHDCQFSFWCDGLPEKPADAVAWSIARDIAQKALDGDVLGHGATHYHAVSVHPWWADTLEPVGMIGNHIFYVWP